MYKALSVYGFFNYISLRAKGLYKVIIYEHDFIFVRNIKKIVIEIVFFIYKYINVKILRNVGL